MKRPREVRLTFTIGDVYDPTYQKRTDAIDDLVKQDRPKTNAMLDKMFQKEANART